MNVLLGDHIGVYKTFQYINLVFHDLIIVIKRVMGCSLFIIIIFFIQLKYILIFPPISKSERFYLYKCVNLVQTLAFQQFSGV